MAKDSKITVRFNNDMNRIQLGRLSAISQDLFFVICVKLRNQSKNEIELPFDEIRCLANYQHSNSNTELYEDLRKMSCELMSLYNMLPTKTGLKLFHFFNSFEFPYADATDKKAVKAYTEDKDVIVYLKPILKVSVCEEFAYLINELTKGFTKFDLEEITKLKSRHSKTLYRLLKQFSSTGVFRCDLQGLRYLFGTEDKYKEPKAFNRRVITPSVEEVSSYFPNLSCLYEKAKDGKTITGLVFTFDI